MSEREKKRGVVMASEQTEDALASLVEVYGPGVVPLAMVLASSAFLDGFQSAMVSSGVPVEEAQALLAQERGGLRGNVAVAVLDGLAMARGGLGRSPDGEPS